MGMRKKLILFFLLFVGHYSFAQTVATVNQLDTTYQTCIDGGANMLGCAQTYYTQMDSMLTVVYNKKLLAIADSSKRLQLATTQTKWLASRDEYFTQINSGGTQDGGLTGDDRLMNIADKKALFIKSRVVELLKK
jgi:uncharacterized protein YecT (DUF1311 family)